MIAILLALADDGRPPILSKADWGGTRAIAVMEPQRIERITIHHAGVRTNTAVDFPQRLRNLQSWCQREGELASGKKKPAWPDTPYHYYISPDGTIAQCRDPRYSGDTNTEYNPKGHLLICLEGNLDETKATPAQLESLHRLTKWAAHHYGVPAKYIRGHNDYAVTGCPGKTFAPELVRLREAIRECQSGDRTQSVLDTLFQK